MNIIFNGHSFTYVYNLCLYQINTIVLIDLLISKSTYSELLSLLISILGITIFLLYLFLLINKKIQT